MAHKGIIKDNKNKWLIHTTIQGKSCTIRGFNSFKEANDNYDIEIDKWKKQHNLFDSDLSYSSILNDFFDYRSKRITYETLKKDKMYMHYWSIRFESDTIRSVYNIDRLKIIYSDLVNDEIKDVRKNRIINAFNEFTSFCYMNRYISDNTFNATKMLLQPLKIDLHHETTKRYIPISHFKAVLSEINKVNDNLFKLALFVLYFGGLRCSELLGLLGSDIDLDNKVIKVQRQLASNGELTTTLKTSNSYRSVPMNNELLSLMQKICTKNNDRLFPYSHTSFRRKLSYYEKQANVPNYTAHEYRHTFCSNLASKISNISEVSYCAKVSGHTSSMFLNTYVKSLDNELVKKFF